MSELERQKGQLSELTQVLSFDEQHRRQHEMDHTALLRGYTDYQLGALSKKNRYKKIFFWLCIALLFLPIAFVGIVYRAIFNGWLPADAYSSLAAIITAIISAAVDIIALPKIMGEYFFNKEEDKNIIQLFSNAQKNDQYLDAKNDERQEILNKIIKR